LKAGQFRLVLPLLSWNVGGVVVVVETEQGKNPVVVVVSTEKAPLA
jgi:hypothetical protein